ncbi:MAG: winged helix-turn-helix transcriptional regulator [Oscillospiraceae bacterium]|nr:winged helix-turn-helix transcriptional regulator [Oscillospiraceae bacterium]
MKFYDIELDRTDCTVIHQDVVDHVKERMPDDEVLLDLADTFKLFSDSTRLKILYALTEAEMCVCDISVLLGMSKSSVSHQLQVLKQSNLIKYRKAGRVVYYSLADDHVKTICRMGMEHVLEDD